VVTLSVTVATMSFLNPFHGLFPLPPPSSHSIKATATQQYRYVKRDRSQCAARVADLRTIHNGGHLEPLDIVAAYYISDHTSDSYVFSMQELESVRWALLLGQPMPDLKEAIVERIGTIWTELMSQALQPSRN
jgi:hypothetical protein